MLLTCLRASDIMYTGMRTITDISLRCFITNPNSSWNKVTFPVTANPKTPPFLQDNAIPPQML